MEWLKYSRHYAKHTFTKILSSTIIILILKTVLGMKFGHREVAGGPGDGDVPKLCYF